MNARHCNVCGRDAGFPNVRRAQSKNERDALDQRVSSANASSLARGVSHQLNAFKAAVDSSSAVMNRSLGALSEWLNGSNELFVTFHKQVAYLGRHPQDNEWDPQREAAEAAINPYVYGDISYAALSLDGRGMTYYGDYAVTLSTFLIDDRSSVFEENPYHFNRTHHITIGQPVPVGYRAIWFDRSDLAVAKLHSKIDQNTVSDDFPNILMEDRRDQPDCDYVEVHIYGAVHRKSISRVEGPLPITRADKALYRQAAKKLKELGAQMVAI